MNAKVIFRRRLPGVSYADHLEAVRNGTREALLGPPDELPLAAYGLVREIEAAFGAAPPPVDAAALRKRLELWEREWREAEPCGPDGEALAEAAPPLPMSPMQRRQYRPRRPTQNRLARRMPQPGRAREDVPARMIDREPEGEADPNASAEERGNDPRNPEDENGLRGPTKENGKRS